MYVYGRIDQWIGLTVWSDSGPPRLLLTPPITRNPKNRQERGVGYQDLLEKAEFTRRLAEARVKGITKPPPAPAEEEPAPSAASAGPTAGEASTASTSSSGSSGPSASASAGAGEKKSEEAKAVDEAARYEKALEEIMKMRVSEIKQELDLLKVSHKGLFEKREFAEALAKARLAPGACSRLNVCVLPWGGVGRGRGMNACVCVID